MTTPTPSPLAQRVAQVMRSRGLTQEFVEDAAGLSGGQISRLLNGQRQNPRLPTIERLATALGVSVQWLINGTGEMDAGAAVAPAPPPAVTKQAPARPAKRLDDALALAFRKGTYSVEAFDGVRAVFSKAKFLLIENGDLVQAAHTWLRAADRLIDDGIEVSETTLLQAMVPVTGHLAARSAEENERGDRELEELGVERRAPATPSPAPASTKPKSRGRGGELADLRRTIGHCSPLSP